MADKGMGIQTCSKHGEYYLDAPDSACPSCEDAAAEQGVSVDEYIEQQKHWEKPASTFATPKDALAAVVALTMQNLRKELNK